VFQCSSASRKFLNARQELDAEFLDEFQCSSASRKFLNAFEATVCEFDAEFQCSSASRKFLNKEQSNATTLSVHVSVLFSEPKIPQFG